MAHEQKPLPPRWAQILLQYRLPVGLSEEVQGDLDELFDVWVEEMGVPKARWRYIRQALGFLRPLPERKDYYMPTRGNMPPPLLTTYSSINQIGMLRNYIRFAWRNLAGNKAFSAINILGLALGIATCLTVALLVIHEESYDSYHSKRERIFRVEGRNVREGHTYPGNYTGLVHALRNDIPEIEVVVPMYKRGDVTIQEPISGKLFKEPVVFAGNELFRTFDYTWIAGNPKTGLFQPNTIIITRSQAEKIFGTTQVLGKILQYDSKHNLMVTGVVEDFPITTSFPFDVLISFASIPEIMPDFDLNKWNGWGDDFQIFALLKESVDPQQVSRHFPGIITKYMGKEAVAEKQFLLAPLHELHYTSSFSGHTANPTFLKTLFWIGIFVLCIACINFINLTTTQAIKRAKEIGVRKAVGSNRLALIYQFLIETALIAGIAILFAIPIVYGLLPLINSILGVGLSITDLFSWHTGTIVSCLFVATVLLAGTYPAFYLSAMAPIWALRSNNKAITNRGFTLRQGLVIAQFTVSLVLISCTLLIRQQLSFFQNADLGFNKNAILTVGLPDNSPAKLQLLRIRLLQSAQIKNVSFSFNSASAESNWMQMMEYRLKDTVVRIKTQMKMVDANYIDTYGIQLLKGEVFREGDTLPKVIANEIFLHHMGIQRPQDAIGQVAFYGDGQESVPIVGVVKDFHVNSLHQNIDPTLMMVVPKHFYQGSIKLQSEQLSSQSIKETLAYIENIWTATFPNQLFEYKFLDDTLSQAYQNEIRTEQMIEVSTFLAIVIACLGLFGLTLFTTQSRIKEIGIRKVLGATVSSIVVLLSRDFVKLVAIALCIATPIAWYMMSQWLQSFAFKITIVWWVFVVAGGGILIITLITISFQAIKAALTNPVKSLRTE
ncbi:permease prefix domain 2-containing transporter [Cytophagaceae bacterium DM2B3-1]|uniref:Permease prefix domain 2-containing transporter n=1 Tax=Xanthocytophaga flava TaxID=3048013 RepID=A0ABT7CW07_9BACT|nr:ABC transporter permease [Xanthocytophaga flavus]MDJ1496779.1 permease prefix domain 2-containing transporter [Xanthocytophaga flavus]